MLQFDAIRLTGLTQIELPIFGNVSAAPFQISAADGLGPPELEMVLAENHTPGGIFVSRRTQGREITLRIGLNPNHSMGQSISDLRYLLYGLLSPGVDPQNQSILFDLMLDNVAQANVVGYVKRIEIVPFNKTPEVQLTIACLGPYFNAPSVSSPTIAPGSGTFTINNTGLAPTGIAFEVEFSSVESTFTLTVVGGKFMRFATQFQAGDILTVDTSEANRFVGLKRNGDYIRFMEILDDTSEWIILHGGEHVFQYTNIAGLTWNYFNYRLRYWGI